LQFESGKRIDRVKTGKNAGRRRKKRKIEKEEEKNRNT